LAVAPRRGAVTVEFAVVAPVFFLLVLGIIEFGHAFMITGILTDAARRACRVAIIEGTSTSQIQGAATDYLSNFNISGEAVQVTINDGNGNITEASGVPAYTELTVVVQVDATSVSWLPTGTQIYLPGFGTVPIGITGNLQGQFTMRRE
jgi:Flp pilus assembly protein TadG